MKKKTSYGLIAFIFCRPQHDPMEKICLKQYLYFLCKIKKEVENDSTNPTFLRWSRTKTQIFFMLS